MISPLGLQHGDHLHERRSSLGTSWLPLEEGEEEAEGLVEIASEAVAATDLEFPFSGPWIIGKQKPEPLVFPRCPVEIPLFIKVPGKLPELVGALLGASLLRPEDEER
jgi:hypothetical protein